MALTYLADTSVLTRLANPEVKRVVASRLEAGEIGRCAMSDLEIGYAARNVGEWDALHRALKQFPYVSMEPVDFERSSGVQRALAALSQRGQKVPDLLIAAAAERRGLTVLHYDHDFELISEATGQAHEWVVCRGSID